MDLPTITTQRLVLRKLRSTDIPRIVKYANNRGISDNTLNIPYPYKEEDAVYWINMADEGARKSDGYIFGITLKAVDQFIGGISLTMEPFDKAMIGYWLAEPYWNKGYMTEATAAILQFGFENLGLRKIYSNHLEQNPASGKVMINNSMIKEAVLKDHVKKGERYFTLIQYRLTEEEYCQIQNDRLSNN